MVAEGSLVLDRKLGLVGLMATGICSMLGASVFIVPFMIQRNVPGIGSYVIPAFILAAIPSFLAALAYSILGSAMPRAGGSYIYASRGLNPYFGFIASFSQWFGLSVVIGVISYVMIPFFRDAVLALGLISVADWLDRDTIRMVLAMVVLWIFVGINIRGATSYQRTLIPLMFLMFLLGCVVVVAGFSFEHADFYKAIPNAGFYQDTMQSESYPGIRVLFTASSVLFASFIGFDSIAQAGGEARNPTRNIPLAICATIVLVGAFYMLFTGAVYHAVPWSYVAAESVSRDVTAPGLLEPLLHPAWSVLIIAGAAVALLNDLPAMLLSVSRLTYAWSTDGLFPAVFSRLDKRHRTPRAALVLSGLMASAGIAGCHLASDFFLGVDIMVTSMLVNFILMCITLIALPRVNPKLHKRIAVIKNIGIQRFIGVCGILSLSLFLSFHIYKDLSSGAESWYLRSTPLYLIVMAAGTAVYWWYYNKIKDIKAVFKELPKT